MLIGDHLKYTRKFRHKFERNLSMKSEVIAATMKIPIRKPFTFTTFNVNTFIIFNTEPVNTFSTFTLLIRWKYL